MHGALVLGDGGLLGGGLLDGSSLLLVLDLPAAERGEYMTNKHICIGRQRRMTIWYLLGSGLGIDLGLGGGALLADLLYRDTDDGTLHLGHTAGATEEYSKINNNKRMKQGYREMGAATHRFLLTPSSFPFLWSLRQAWVQTSLADFFFW